MSKTEILELQRRLNEVGLAYLVLGEPLEEDGIYGPNTDRVYTEWLNRDNVMPSVTPEPAKPWWTSRGLLGGLATIIVGIAGLAGYALDVAQITEIVVSASALLAGILSTVGSIKRKAPIDPTLVARLPHGRDVRLPVRTYRKPESQSGPGRETGPFGY
jgi:hypothetical protein